MGMVEGENNFAIGENEGGTCPTKSNFVDDRKCPNKSNPKLKSSHKSYLNKLAKIKK